MTDNKENIKLSESLGAECPYPTQKSFKRLGQFRKWYKKIYLGK